MQWLEALELVCELGQQHSPGIAVASQHDVRSVRLAAECAHEVSRLTDGKAPDAHAEQLEHAAQRHRLTGLDVDEIDADPAIAAGLYLTDARGPQRREVGALLVTDRRGRQHRRIPGP